MPPFDVVPENWADASDSDVLPTTTNERSHSRYSGRRSVQSGSRDTHDELDEAASPVYIALEPDEVRVSQTSETTAQVPEMSFTRKDILYAAYGVVGGVVVGAALALLALSGSGHLDILHPMVAFSGVVGGIGWIHTAASHFRHR